MKVVFCWTHISGYMAACWRELAKKHEVDLHVIAWQAGGSAKFQDNIMTDVPTTLLAEKDQNNSAHILQIVLGVRPDVIVLSGWISRAYRELAKFKELKGKKFVMTMDNPWLQNPRQFLAKFALGSFLKRMSCVVVPGERSWQYARRLGMEACKIRRGVYGVDVTALKIIGAERERKAWPKSFFFAGRYVQTKAVDVLARAYRFYRQAAGDDSWPLVCCGTGPMAPLLENCPGIHNKGFIQPKEMSRLWLEAGAFIMPSRFDPWPLAIVEACAAGLPVIATEECGSTIECVRHLYNGYLIPADDTDALAEAMLKVQHNYKNLPEMGKSSTEMAQPYSAEMWAERWLDLLRE
jgi:glycosyltransferase involved in cell wall biosynthesis